MSFEQIIPELESMLSDIWQWFMNNKPEKYMLENSIFFSAHKKTKPWQLKITLSNQVVLKNS